MKMDLREVGCDAGDWIDLAQDRVQIRDYIRTVMNLRGHYNQLVIYDQVRNRSVIGRILYLPSSLAALDGFPAESGILISILGP